MVGARARVRIWVLVTSATVVWVMDDQAASQQRPDSVDCTEGGTTQYEMNVCAGRAAEASKSKLEALLHELGEKLEPAGREELQAIQVEWERFRERDCQWECGLFEGGSIASTVYAYCVQSRTDERIERLAIFLCEGAGMTGPCEASEKYSRGRKLK